MLYWITQQLPARIPGAHVFAYLTFRAILATASALGLSLLVGPSLIRHLVRGQIGQVVRDDGPPTHLLKAGTPTMGGTLILVTTLASTLLWAELSNRLVWTVLGVTFAWCRAGSISGNRWPGSPPPRRSTTPPPSRRRPRCFCRSSRPFTRRSRPSASSCSPI